VEVVGVPVRYCGGSSADGRGLLGSVSARKISGLRYRLIDGSEHVDVEVNVHADLRICSSSPFRRMF
jgi:hypothetical protein